MIHDIKPYTAFLAIDKKKIPVLHTMRPVLWSRVTTYLT